MVAGERVLNLFVFSVSIYEYAETIPTLWETTKSEHVPP